MAKLLETSAAESQVEDFGLRLSTARRLSNLGPFSLVVREEITARRAIETLGRYLQLHSELLLIRIEDAGDLVILRAEIVRGARMPRRQGIELFVGYLFRILQELLGPSWKARRVLFVHSAPASLSGHIALFGRIVDFDAEFNGIVCRAQGLAGSASVRDPVMARYARMYLDSMISRPDITLADKVRWLVREPPPLGRCSVEKVAQHLGVDRRTVHRHLAQNGETFSSLLDEVRAELAETYLEGNKTASPMSRTCSGSRRSARSRDGIRATSASP